MGWGSLAPNTDAAAAQAGADQPAFTAGDSLSWLFDAWKRGMDALQPRKAAGWGSSDNDPAAFPNPLSLSDAAQTWQDTPGLDLVQGFSSGGLGLAGSIKGAAPSLVRSIAQRAAAAALPMDQAARMARAQEMGFRTSMPLYHGSGNTFSEFTSVPTTQAGMAAPGVSMTLDPAVANEFAAARGAQTGGRSQVYPLLHRADNPAVLDLAGDESHAAVVGALRDAFEGGHDSVMVRNYTTPGGLRGQKTIIVRDANQLRSPNAAFDPAQKFSPNLLAGIAGASAMPLAAAPFGLGAQQDQDQ